MEGVTAYKVVAVVKESYFEKENSDQLSWKLCIQSTSPRSEVVIFFANVCYVTAGLTLYVKLMSWNQIVRKLQFRYQYCQVDLDTLYQIQDYE